MRTNYVLVDYENVQPDALEALANPCFRVIVFVGATQNKISFDTAAALQKLGEKGEYVKVSGTGANALDFHIAFRIGLLVAQDPTAFFHIISKDTGFDVLIAHLKARQVYSARWTDVASIPLLKMPNPTQPEDAVDLSRRLDLIVEKLSSREDNRPKTMKSLTSAVHALFQKKLTPKALEDLLVALRSAGIIHIDGEKVAYRLPGDRQDRRVELAVV